MINQPVITALHIREQIAMNAASFTTSHTFAGTPTTAELVSHRFSTVRAADHIIVLDQGRIIEQGDHESLLRNAGRYAQMYQIQADAYRTH